MTNDLDLMKKMSRCGHVIHHRRCLNQSQNRLLLFLYHHGPLSQKELLELMHIQSGSLSEVVSKVEKNGFIKKEKLNSDKRNFVLTLTESGKEQAILFENHQQHLATKFFNSLDDSQKDQLDLILTLLLNEWKDFKPCKGCEKE